MLIDESAAKTLKDDNVILATVDATEEKELAGKFGIKGYPTLKFFRNGKATEYNGGRTADTIVSWLRKKTGPAAQELTDAASVEAFADLSKVAVVGFFADAQGAEYDAFVAAATDDDERAYGYSLDSATAEAQGASVPSVVLFKKFDEGKNVLEGSLTKKTVEEFVAKNSIPLVIPFTMDAVGQIFQSPLGKVAFLFSQTELPDFAAVATKYKGKLVFATSDGSVDRLNSHVGLEKSDFPKLVILETGAQMKKFPLTSASLDESSMSEHIDAYFAGDLKPWFKSEKAPADNSGPVTVIVGNNFNEIVLDETKDVLLEVYAPCKQCGLLGSNFPLTNVMALFLCFGLIAFLKIGCGHCKKLVPIYDELGEHFKSNPNIVSSLFCAGSVLLGKVRKASQSANE